MDEKLKQFIEKAGVILERVIAVIVIIAIVVGIIFLIVPFKDFILHFNDADSDAFIVLLGFIMNIVIGIEFLKMLGDPELDKVLDVVMFAIIRHMIISETTALENLLTICGLAVVVILKGKLWENWSIFQKAKKKKKPDPAGNKK